MDCLIHCLYNNYKLIPKIVNQVLDLGIIEFYVNKLFSMEMLNIYIENFDKIYFLMNNLSDESYTTYTENVSEINNNTNISNTCLTNICTSNTNTNISEVKSQNNKIIFEELFINIYNKLYTHVEINETSNCNFISITKTESSENKVNDLYEENKRLLFKYLANILKCIFLFPKNKQFI